MGCDRSLPSHPNRDWLRNSNGNPSIISRSEFLHQHLHTKLLLMKLALALAVFQYLIVHCFCRLKVHQCSATFCRLNPVSLLGKHVSMVSAGVDHCLVVDSDGALYSWGNNSRGQLGDGTTINRNVPVLISGGAIAGKTIVLIRAGDYHSLAIDSNGSMYSWGFNSNCRVGDGTALNSSVPVQISSTGNRLTRMNASTLCSFAKEAQFHSDPASSCGNKLCSEGDLCCGGGRSDVGQLRVTNSTSGGQGEQSKRDKRMKYAGIIVASVVLALLPAFLVSVGCFLFFTRKKEEQSLPNGVESGEAMNHNQRLQDIAL